ncbi:MAG: glycoside hydrolase family 88 protein [Odoribacteraceae bacterium]|jgi:rhamnogalacturonyl hydrolase YesR|nr:glycoside hydrolase family 88 protein [Odoribacteraceae bacterium]
MKTTTLLLAALLAASPIKAQPDASPLLKADITRVANTVADWQIAHHPAVRHSPTGWENAALYTGLIRWAVATNDTAAGNPRLAFLLRLANRAGWQPERRMYHADDLCVSQLYIELYRLAPRPSRLWPTLARVRWIIDNPPENNMRLDNATATGFDKWSWCDALFMAPPVYAKLYSLTGDESYIQFADREYRQTVDFLYDPDERLFFRDHTYFDRRERNGQKIFWGRGNGWVVAGLVEILRELPPGNPHRPYYEKLYTDLCHRLLQLQQPDGYWRASLLDPDAYPSPETSSTGFILYALAYGINQGILPADPFLPAARRAWQALLSSVSPDGKLGHVQPVGADPRQVTPDMTEVYGVGAFLLAASQILDLATE